MAALVLGACGSGGGGSGGVEVGNRLPSDFETQEYLATYGLDAIAASSAYAQGATGRGVRVAVIDTGVDIDHPEFQGALAPASIDIVSGSRAAVDDNDGHGTAVAGVIGARRNDEFTHGVAFESEILAIRAGNGGSCGSGCDFQISNVVSATDYAVEHGAQVINYSLGNPNQLDGSLADALARAADAGAVLVFAAGNEGNQNPSFPARFAIDARAEGQAIAVGAVDRDNRITSFSNRAGTARSAFLVAPGVRVLAPQSGGGASLVSGTSFAAPHVAGAAAVVLDAAPFLQPAEVVDILLQSASDLGEPGTDAVYGRGLLNLRAALRPLGQASVPLGERVRGDAAPLATSGLLAGGAFGPGPRLGRAMFLDGYGRPYLVDLDQRVRAHEGAFDLLQSLGPAPESRTLRMRPGADFALTMHIADARQHPDAFGPRLQDGGEPSAFLRAEFNDASEVVFTRRYGLGAQLGLARLAPERTSTLLTAGSAVQPPYLALAGGGDALVINQALGDGFVLSFGAATAAEETNRSVFRPSRQTAAVVELSRADATGRTIGLQLGRLLESDGVLGSRGAGALALDQTATTFLGVAGRLPVSGRTDLLGQASYGLSEPEPSGRTLLRDFSTLHGMAFSVGIATRGVLTRGDGLTLMVAQPLRVIGGSASLDRPLARTFDGGIVRTQDEVDLAPQGQELDFEAAYQLALTERVAIGLNWLSRLEPGHDPDQQPEHAVSVRLRSQF